MRASTKGKKKMTSPATTRVNNIIARVLGGFLTAILKDMIFVIGYPMRYNSYLEEKIRG
jgi:hypothetical protein